MILAVRRFFENCGFVLLDAVVCDGVIFGEQWYTGGIFFGAARGEAPELRRPGQNFEKWKTKKFLYSKDSIHETL